MLFALALACAPKPAELPAETVELADPTPSVSSVDPEFQESHMSMHYTLLTSARDALIRGDMEGMREPMSWLATHDKHPGIPEEYLPYVQELRGASRVAANATSVEAAAHGVATAAVICGECHTRMSVGPRFEEEPALPDRKGVNWHMARHRWAADRMWEGMIQPSDTAWQLGVAALQEDPLEAEELHAGMDMSSDEAKVAEWLHGMGEFGAHMEGSMARSAFYGEMLGNCSDCHSTMREAPAE